jgi:hypothetical protein
MPPPGLVATFLAKPPPRRLGGTVLGFGEFKFGELGQRPLQDASAKPNTVDSVSLIELANS